MLVYIGKLCVIFILNMKKCIFNYIKDEFFDELFNYFESCVEKTSVVFLWIRELQCHKKYGYQILIKEFTRDSKEAGVLARNEGKALTQLEEKDVEDYNKSISEEALSDRQLNKLERLTNPTLSCTAESVRRERKAGYQENLLEDLLDDILCSRDM